MSDGTQVLTTHAQRSDSQPSALEYRFPSGDTCSAPAGGTAQAERSSMRITLRIPKTKKPASKKK